MNNTDTPKVPSLDQCNSRIANLNAQIKGIRQAAEKLPELEQELRYIYGIRDTLLAIAGSQPVKTTDELDDFPKPENTEPEAVEAVEATS